MCTLKIEKHVLGILVLLGLVAAPFGRAQDQGVQGGKPADRMQGPAAGPEVRQRPLAGKITAIGSDTLEIAKPNGDTVKVKLRSEGSLRIECKGPQRGPRCGRGHWQARLPQSEATRSKSPSRMATP